MLRAASGSQVTNEAMKGQEHRDDAAGREDGRQLQPDRMPGSVPNAATA